MIERQLAWRAPLTILLMTACLLFLGLGLRTFLQPSSAAAFFGVPSSAPEAMVFVKAYGARNIAISLMAVALLLLDLRQALAVLLALVALVAAFDAFTMYGFSGMTGAAKHVAYVAVLGSLAVATALRGKAHSVAKGAF